MTFSQQANAIFGQVISDYHLTDHVDATIHNPYKQASIEYQLYLKCWIDTVQWHLEDIIRDVDMVLLMSVNPGFGGQRFIENTLRKVSRLREMILSSGSHALIEVDGGVQADTAPRLIASGADVLVSGSFVFKASDPIEAIERLRK